MDTRRGLAPIAVAGLALALAACGGGGGLPPNPVALVVTATSLPHLLSGQALDWEVPLEGGCGGPYVMQVIDGHLPRGLSLDPPAHAIRGYVLESGPYEFTLQLTDTGCTPFSSTTATYRGDVGVGALAVVEATRDGVPGLLRPGDAGYDPAWYSAPYPALPAVVYGEFTTIVLVVGGGVAPYSAEVWDRPGVDDTALPTGALIPEDSTSITGSALEVGPGGRPFLCTARVRDAIGNETLFTFWWLVRTPPIVIANEALADGVCGTPYSETFFIVDGVPPFVYELVEDGPGVGNSYEQTADPSPPGDFHYQPPDPPLNQTGQGDAILTRIDATYYPDPADTAGGTLDYRSGYVTPPEGLRLDEAGGVLAGIPRRGGWFRIHFHVQSALVPYNYGQQNWRTFEFRFEVGPAIAQDPDYTVDKAFLPWPYAMIADAEQGRTYNPDGGDLGLQLKAAGGVGKDGWTDAPHASQATRLENRTDDTQEVVGAFTWTVDYDPDGDNAVNGGANPIPGMELKGWKGVWWAPTPSLLVKQAPQELAFTVSDEQLPTSYRHSDTRKVRFGVGPDTVVITESLTSSTHNTYYGGFSMNDPNLSVKIIELASGGSSTLRSPTSDDLTGEGASKHGVPATAGASTTIATLLSGIDIARASVNPTWWAYDNHNLNPLAARAFQHGDMNMYYLWNGVHYVYDYLYSTPWQRGMYQAMPDVTAVRLPKARNVSANVAGGVYTNGGKLYVFDAQSYFGVFVVRPDGRLYVPAAFDKSKYQSFGDNWTFAHTTDANKSNSSLNKIAQMSVSPDGRFAAMKLRTSSTYDQYEKADSTPVVVFSLTGERPWDDGSGAKTTYKIVETGASGSSSTGEVLFASSLTLTDEFLYYVVGNSYGGSWLYTSWKDHFIYRYDVDGGGSVGSRIASSDPNWANTSGNPMQTPFQMFHQPFVQSSGDPDYGMIEQPGYNSWEGSLAPHPFRVSADGKSCAILAGISTSSTSDTNVLMHHVWVDTGGALHRVSQNRRRHAHGGGRGYALQEGPMRYSVYHYGSWTGPTTALEISDDGLKVAAVYWDYTGYTYSTSYSYWYQYREHVVAFTPASGSDWTGGGTETLVTSPCFSSSIVWRMGALVFTRDNKGLVFWAGYSSTDPRQSSYYYNNAYEYRAPTFVGSLYGFDFTQSAPGVYSLLGSSDGGRSSSVGTKYTSGSLNSPSTSSWQTDGGVIKPIGGFLSLNGNFFYMVTRGGLTASGTADHQVLGVNVRSVSTSDSINGKTDFRAFRLGGMPTQRGFLDGYRESMYGIGNYYYADYYWYAVYSPGGTQGVGLQVAATDNGRIFVATHFQYDGPYSYPYYYYGGPTNPTYCSYDPNMVLGHVLVFDPNVGGSLQVIDDGLGGWTVAAGWWPSWPNDYRPIVFVEASDDGRQVAYVYRYNSPYDFTAERVAYVGKIDLDPGTGALRSGSFFSHLTTANSRVAPTLTHHTLGGRVYVARGTTNESNRYIYEFTPKSGATPEVIQLSHGPARYNILHAGR